MNNKQSEFLEITRADDTTFFDVTSGFPVKNRKINVESIISSDENAESKYTAASSFLVKQMKNDAFRCTILTEEEYFALTTYDIKTLYVITAISETTGELEITSAFLGELKFATGGGGDVSGIPIETLTLSEYDVTIERGATKLITASWQPTDATNTTLSWISNNTLVATVDTGTISGVERGTAVITVKARSGAKETVNVTVVVSLVSLEMQGTGKIVTGVDEELTLVATPADADFNITSLTSTNANITVEKDTLNDKKLILKTSATTGSTIIKAVNFNGKEATINVNVVPYIINVASDNIDKTDSSVTSIFTNWTIDRKGSVTSYKYTESYMKDGVKTTLQSVDYTAIPDNNIIQIELYAEFGNKIIDWTFKNDAGNEESITYNILYKEPELVHYSFDVNVTCTPEEASAMTMEVPFFKYDKKFAYNLRNDDTKPSLWRMGFRYVNREWDATSIPYINGYTQSQLDSMSASDLRKAPRRLGYTDGTGIIKTFCFDTAGMVVEGSGTTENPAVILWDRTDNTDRVDLVDTLKAKDYGGHFLVHNMVILPSDNEHYTPKFENDYTYALQRDRQTIYNKFGYTSVHFANPDGDWWYTRPVIKDPKTLLLSGGGKAFTIDPDGIYGKPSFRSTFAYDADLSNVPLSEIRNTLLVWYVYNDNNPYAGNLWKTQYSKAIQGFPTFAVELTHHIGFCNRYPDSWEGNRNFFNEVYDVVGANGVDYIWFCSGDEVVEYMYYQRVANITKTITSTGCKFNISFDIPDYLSYKTYSVKIKNLPSNAVVEMSTDKTLTYYSKNMNTGLINWGVSTDIAERANRYIAAYKASPTNDNLDKAWYFARQMGELGTALAAQLPAFSEKPVIDSVIYSTTPSTAKLNITTINGNKEFGEADYLDVSTDINFSTSTSYRIPYDSHKYYNSLDAETLKNDWIIDISSDFEVQQTIYVRLRNIYGSSNIFTLNVTIPRLPGVNDPAIDFVLPTKFTSDTEVTFAINYSFINGMRYKLTDTFTDWLTPTSSITIPMTKGTTYTLVVQGKNNLSEIIEKTYTVNFTGKQRVVLFGNVTSQPTVIDTVGYVNQTSKAHTTNKVIKDIEGNNFCNEQGQYVPYFTSQITALRTKWGITGEADVDVAYWSTPALTTENGDYPNSIIFDGTNKKVTLYGAVQTNTTYQTVKYLTGVQQGTYKVRLLVSHSRAGEANAANPVLLRVNNTIQKITDTRIFCNNNTVWQTFDNVTVDADGYMLIGQYTDVMFKSSSNSLPPIVLIEIVKTA